MARIGSDWLALANWRICVITKKKLTPDWHQIGMDWDRIGTDWIGLAMIGKLENIGETENLPPIGTGLAQDWRRLALNWLRIGIGLAWIGLGLAPDWHGLARIGS